MTINGFDEKEYFWPHVARKTFVEVSLPAFPNDHKYNQVSGTGT